MKWFGANWKAPVCVPENHVATPPGDCVFCEHPIVPGQAGLVLPYGGPPEDPRNEVATHRKCYLDALLNNRA